MSRDRREHYLTASQNFVIQSESCKEQCLSQIREPKQPVEYCHTEYLMLPTKCVFSGNFHRTF